MTSTSLPGSLPADFAVFSPPARSQQQQQSPPEYVPNSETKAPIERMANGEDSENNSPVSVFGAVKNFWRVSKQAVKATSAILVQLDQNIGVTSPLVFTSPDGPAVAKKKWTYPTREELGLSESPVYVRTPAATTTPTTEADAHADAVVHIQAVARAMAARRAAAVAASQLLIEVSAAEPQNWLQAVLCGFCIPTQ